MSEEQDVYHREDAFVEHDEDGSRPKVPRLSQLSKPSKDAMLARLKESEMRKTPGFPKGKSPRKGGRTKMAVLGVRGKFVDMNDDFKESIKNANAYRKIRARELYIAHGYVSAGASALLSTAALALAASRYMYEKAIETGDVMLLKQASMLADSARANELSAWELCSREAVARKKTAAIQDGVPWLAVQDGGQEKRGRKAKGQQLDTDKILDRLLSADSRKLVYTNARDTGQAKGHGPESSAEFTESIGRHGEVEVREEPREEGKGEG